MDGLPLISVITTVYNTEKYVERCFDSIMEQTYPNIELIVVNNGSTGNIHEIVKQYQTAYPKRIIKEVALKDNVGLFHGRLAGAEQAEGSYIAFVDSDDRIGIDYYRLLIKKAQESHADMVATDFVYEDENGNLTRDIYNPMPTLDFSLQGPEIEGIFFDEAATSFYWNLIWNKIYSIELWRRSVPYLRENHASIVMCDDIAFSVVFYTQAKHYENIHSPKYYYLRRSDANSVGGNDFKKTEKIIQDILNVFDFFENYTVKIKGESIRPKVEEWKKRYYRLWYSGIKYRRFKHVEKVILSDKLRQGLNISESEKTEDPQDWLFIREQTKYNDGLEKIKKQIADKQIRYVSFDIFDTLIKRNAWEPYDLFQLLNEKFCQLQKTTFYVEFSKIRSYCEFIARKHSKGGRDITIQDIYDQIGQIYHIDTDILEKMRGYEIALECKICSARETGKELLEMAQHLGKKVVLISDMYLSRNDICLLLEKSGYHVDFPVFVSSEVGHTKTDGTLYEYVKRELEIPAYSMMVHIGDNYNSDVLSAKQKGIQSLHLPKAQEIFCNACAEINSGKLFHNAFVQKSWLNTQNTMFDNFGTRCLMALVINKFFDDPFVSYIENTEFNSDPYYMGYFALGFYVLSVCRWIEKTRQENGYKKLHFVSRDGYLLKQAYEMLYPQALTNYLYISREATVTLSYEKGADLLGFSHFVYPLNYSPKSLLKAFEYAMNVPLEDAERQSSEHGFPTKDKFKSKEDCDQFLLFFSEHFLDINKLNTFRQQMKEGFAQQIGPGECTVDVGYSGRPECILSTLLDYPVNAIYLFSNAEKSVINSNYGQFKIHSNQDYFPNVANEILLELFISDTDNSCKALRLEDGKLVPEFKNNKQNFSTIFFTKVLHKGALAFIADVKEFSKSIDMNIDIFTKEYDLQFPLEYLLKMAPNKDFEFLSAAYFDDTMDSGTNESLQILRGKDMRLMNRIEIQLSPYDFIPKWKQAIILLLVDRRTLKGKVKKKLSRHPILLRTAKLLYSIPRAIYHLFKK